MMKYCFFFIFHKLIFEIFKHTHEQGTSYCVHITYYCKDGTLILFY